MSGRPEADFVLVGASEVVTCRDGLDPVPGGAVAARGGTITWVGPERNLEREVDVLPGATRLDVLGRAVLPGLVECHTHLVWAGNRADEFEERLAGKTYAEIAAAGGGILRTVDATRAADPDELAEAARARMDRLARQGVTTIEVKSGYGLETAAELRILEAARRAAKSRPQEVVTTFLGAHTLPREARGDEAARRRYVDTVCGEMIPAVAERGLARFVDVFVDAHAFRVDEARRILETGKEFGLVPKVHADQLADDGAARLAAEVGAVSADHLDHASEEGLRALAAAGTVAVLLPGADLFIGAERWADGRRMIDLGIPVAVSTDLNPGSCPSESLPLMMQLACLRMGLRVDEAILAATRHAAAALGLADRCGSIQPGRRCDLLVLDAEDRRELLYRLGSPPIHLVVAAGRVLV